ncbi:chromatin-associated protein [Grosmannia clavigera kw1407]|uniref:Chromatin-associated protein n=1 Tax=Grosmannia clavigera (strain kw1407 / UAMH 11150) TaxID=655863 RepID=F0XKR5_GROCL|nr:chromatin-associated protein [Grosmannia clavigera kw1407]EFX01608.1 chromatin-associated protein [Grosmannia clavigera kw1407]
MSQQLEDVLEELGIAQYLDAFLDQGFDTWETILDVTESDLDALGVKLGHRRKLQRKIANFRGIAPDAALVSPVRAAGEEAIRPENIQKHDSSNYTVDGRGTVPGVLAKRKYRRHPKPDECAPERPPSAYVLFSNKMREKLKGQNLSFTEIAKLVGENWQTLTPAERKPYETEAQAAKDKYNHAMVVYKKTPEYQRYILYLQEFKARHSNQTQDAFKRIKLSDFSSASSQLSSSAASASPPAHSQQSRQRERSATTSESVSSSDGQHDRDTPHPPSRRERRVGSTVSASDMRYSSASPTPGPHDSLVDVSMRSPHQGHGPDGHADWSPRPMSMSPRESAAGPPPSRKATWASDGQQQQQQRAQPVSVGEAPANTSQLSLPSLSDMFDNRQLPASGLTPSSAGSASPIPPPPGLTGVVGMAAETRPSMLRLDQGSSGASISTVSSSSVSSNYPRTPLDGSLPIHALLSGKPPSPSPPPPSHSHQHRHPSLSLPHSARLVSSSPQVQTAGPASPTHTYSPPPRPYASVTDGHAPSYKDHVALGIAHVNGGDDARVTAVGSAEPTAVSAVLPPYAKQTSLDGMIALLEAGQIVDRRI